MTYPVVTSLSDICFLSLAAIEACRGRIFLGWLSPEKRSCRIGGIRVDPIRLVELRQYFVKKNRLGMIADKSTVMFLMPKCEDRKETLAPLLQEVDISSGRPSSNEIEWMILVYTAGEKEASITEEKDDAG